MSLCWPEFCLDVREVVHIRAECDLSAPHPDSLGPQTATFRTICRNFLKNKEKFLG